MKKNLRITAIVPAYNEEKNIFKVLTSIKNCSDIDEVICINDGSDDRTLSLIRKVPDIKIINLKKNHGKGYAVAKGVEKASGDIVVLFDADIIGINNKIIKKLIYPLKSKRYDVVVGYPKKIDLFKPLTGQRAYFRKDLLPHLSALKKKGYGMEIYLNYIFSNKKVKAVTLEGLKHILKQKKHPFKTFAKLTIKEGFDIFAEVISQKNPFSYLIKTYLYNFYLDRPNQNKVDNHIKKLIRYFKKNILDHL